MTVTESTETTEENARVSAERLALQLLDEEDRSFIDALRAVGLIEELNAEELLRIASELEASDVESRRVEILELYYSVGAEGANGSSRRMKDRFFLQRVGAPATAASLVARLAALSPELDGVVLERIGGADDGPLVMKSGEHFVAVLDDFEEETDSAELDVVTPESIPAGVPMVTVRGLVRGLNVLLDRNGVRERMVALTGDAEREVYVSLGVSEAVQLARDGFLEDDDAEGVMELAAW